MLIHIEQAATVQLYTDAVSKMLYLKSRQK